MKHFNISVAISLAEIEVGNKVKSAESKERKTIFFQKENFWSNVTRYKNKELKTNNLRLKFPTTDFLT